MPLKLQSSCAPDHIRSQVLLKGRKIFRQCRALRHYRSLYVPVIKRKDIWFIYCYNRDAVNIPGSRFLGGSDDAFGCRVGFC